MNYKYSPGVRGFFHPDLHSVFPDDAVEITPEEHAQLMHEQSSGAEIQPCPKTGKPLAVKRTVVAEDIERGIKRERNRRMHGGLLVDGSWYPTDLFSRTQYALLTQHVPDYCSWQTMDKQRVHMDLPKAQQLAKLLIENDNRIFMAAVVHMDQLARCEDPASYDFTHGWPRIFGE